MSHRCFLKRTFALLVKAWALLFSWANNRETRKWHSILISNPRPVFFFFWGGGSFRVWSHVQLNVKSELWMSRNVDSTKDIRRKQRFLGFFFLVENALLLRPKLERKTRQWVGYICTKTFRIILCYEDSWFSWHLCALNEIL